MNKTIILLLATGALVVGGGAFFLASGLRTTVPKADKAVACQVTKVAHVVKIQDDKLQPTHVDGKLCDTLRIENLDDVTREIGFGKHDHHVAYDGIAEKILQKDDTVTVTLVQTGEFRFHDHFHDEVAGSFTVAK
jgi:plastocyanin